MVSGIARVVRNEMPGLSFRTLNVYDSLSAYAAQLVAQTFAGFELKSLDDTEFKLEDGVVQVNRLVVDGVINDEMDKLVNAGTAAATRPTGKIALGSVDATSSLRLAIEAAGDLDSLHFIEQQAPTEHGAGLELAEDEVEISIKASRVSQIDLATVKGQTRSDPSALGMEASGVVTRIGSKDGTRKFNQGDRVMVMAPGAHGTLLRTKADYVGILPDDVSFEEAASIPVALTTAWYALVHLARLSRSKDSLIPKTLLIHDALSTVGQQALHLAKHLGLVVIATVDSYSQADILANSYGVEPSNIVTISSTNVFSLAKVIKKLTPRGRGVDVVIDCSDTLAGERRRQTIDSLASFGHFIRCVVGGLATATLAGVPASNLNANTTISTVDIASLIQSRPDLLTEILPSAFRFLHEGKNEFLGHVGAAFRQVESNPQETTILTYSANDIVPAKVVVRPLDPSTSSSLRVTFDSKAIYVLCGGLGGLGRSLSTLLVNQFGARKLLFLSRSGAAAPSARQLLEDLETSAAQPRVVAYSCDVSDRSSLERAIARAEMELEGKVKGVIQCAMVLRDVLWSNMSYNQWVESTLPKVQGTSNLSAVLPDVDFFVSLSSFAGVFGNRGQANYAAGNCYQDALARYRRRTLGLKAGFTIDVPIMRGIGVLAETGMLDSLRDWEIPYGIGEAEFHHIMQLAIRRDMNLEPDQSSHQMILGIATGASAREAGIPTHST
ncbi:reducing polyketide synthase rdc5 [Colletotrichum liriopes]|uniref:Reducing polyketide synthase rdc5 n=1 Tax=Colletotrichum liriopes TaxID=708192 RepID=A0AA37LU44_9PEZI|nr:reducing polyketide synthase rdc5 [Colletotrichum liriopes]